MWPSVLHTKANRSLDNMKECIDGSLLLYCDTALSPPWWMIRDKRSFGIFAKEAELPTRRRNRHRRRCSSFAAAAAATAPHALYSERHVTHKRSQVSEWTCTLWHCRHMQPVVTWPSLIIWRRPPCAAALGADAPPHLLTIAAAKPIVRKRIFIKRGGAGFDHWVCLFFTAAHITTARRPLHLKYKEWHSLISPLSDTQPRQLSTARRRRQQRGAQNPAQLRKAIRSRISICFVFHALQRINHPANFASKLMTHHQVPCSWGGRAF